MQNNFPHFYFDERENPANLVIDEFDKTKYIIFDIPFSIADFNDSIKMYFSTYVTTLDENDPKAGAVAIIEVGSYDNYAEEINSLGNALARKNIGISDRLINYLNDQGYKGREKVFRKSYIFSDVCENINGCKTCGKGCRYNTENYIEYCPIRGLDYNQRAIFSGVIKVDENGKLIPFKLVDLSLKDYINENILNMIFSGKVMI